MAAKLPSTHDLDFLISSARHDDDEAVRLRLMRFILEAVSNPLRQEYEREASQNYQYIENDFYTAEELAEFAQRGQPPTKRNEIAPHIERLAGQFIQTRPAMTLLGRNTPADDAVGARAQDYLRWNDQVNFYEFEEQDMVWDGLVGGVGWLKSYIKRNELGQLYECVRSRNPFNIFKDPYATKYDPNEDAKYMLEGSWMDVEDAIALFPDREAEILATVGASTAYAQAFPTGVDRSLLTDEQLTGAAYSLSVMNSGNNRRRVRPFEIWYRRKVQVYYLMTVEGVTALPIPLDAKTARAAAKELGNVVVPMPIYQDRMYMALVLADLVIHHDLSPHTHNFFPYVPFYSGLKKNGNPNPHVSRLVPINESINKRESKALALMSNRQIIAEKNAIADADEATTEIARPDGYLEVQEGALSGQAPKVVIRDNMDLGQGQMALLQEDKDAIRRVSGQGNEAMGMPSEVRSGSGIARKQMMSAMITMPMTNHLRRTRYLKTRLSFAYAQQYLTEEMTFQITDDPMAARAVTLTKDDIQKLKERTYDIVITETKDYATLREQQAEMLLTVLPQLAKLGPGMVKVGIQLTELRDKEGLMKLIDAQMQPPPVQPKVSLAFNWPDMTPEEKAFMAMTIFQSQELAQAIMQKGDDPAFLTKIKADLAKTQIQEGTRAQVERNRLDLSALQTAVEGRLTAKQIAQSDMNDMMGAMPGGDMNE